MTGLVDRDIDDHRERDQDDHVEQYPVLALVLALASHSEQPSNRVVVDAVILGQNRKHRYRNRVRSPTGAR